MTASLRIDLEQPPDQRWAPLAAHAEVARALVSSYIRDLGGIDRWCDLLVSYRDALLDDDTRREIAAVAAIVGAPELEVLAGNLYYDALKVALGCTAFAVDTDDGPLLARNLDWWSEDRLLARSTVTLDFVRGGQVAYRTVGWPGFLGCLSGVAPGRFAVTLNAVLSADPPALAPPVVFVLRQVLASAPSFTAAVDRLASAPIASDCLLLVTGVGAGEAAVIERTPTRAAVRRAVDGVLVVTNDYRSLAAASTAPGALAATSCGRHDRAVERIRNERPADSAACFDILADGRVRMNMTVQHMVLHAASGGAEVRVPTEVVIA